MIGKPVPHSELQEVLRRQPKGGEFIEQLREELKALKPDECLLYEASPGVPWWVNAGLSYIVDKIKGLKMVKEGSRVYVYREK